MSSASLRELVDRLGTPSGIFVPAAARVRRRRANERRQKRACGQAQSARSRRSGALLGGEECDVQELAASRRGHTGSLVYIEVETDPQHFACAGRGSISCIAGLISAPNADDAGMVYQDAPRSRG